MARPARWAWIFACNLASTDVDGRPALHRLLRERGLAFLIGVRGSNLCGEIVSHYGFRYGLFSAPSPVPLAFVRTSCIARSRFWFFVVMTSGESPSCGT